MEISNGTCYNTDDLRALWERVHATIVSNSSSYHIRVAPKMIRVGYYTPVGTSSLYVKEASRRAQNSDSPRISIVKRTKLPLGSPLQQLAKAADGSPELLPPEVVLQLATAMSRLVVWGGVNLRSDAWSWLSTFEVRFSLRAKRGEAAKAKIEDKRARLHRLRAAIRTTGDEIRKFERAAAIARDEKRALIQTAQELAQEVGEAL